MASIVSTLAPVKCNSTVLAVEDVGVDPGIAKMVYGHSGNRFGSIMTVSGADRAVTFRTPLKQALDLFGLNPFKLTTFEVYLARFLDYQKDPAAVHTKLNLAASCTAMGVVQGASVNKRGIAMADVLVVPISNAEMTDPLAVTGSVALPTLGAEPALFSLGSATIDGTRLDGVQQHGFTQNWQYKTNAGDDGGLYPTACWFEGGDPSLSIQVEDPITTLTRLGLLGTNLASGASIFYRPYTNGVLGATGGLSISVTAGRPVPGEIKLTHRARNSVGIVIDGLSATDTHPFTYATGVAIP